ncbi:MAG: serine/threonine-protein kinase [Candidatus Melainabacteria bacterium]|nr:serine/threonine-protein kinase [Candidatus Melainabacteria bacterium]
MELPAIQNDDLTGTVLVERFHITGKLGQGGMGAIYTAHDSVLARDVAIKTIARTNLNDQELMRFQREAKAASTLKHPNVIQMLDFGVLESGQPFMVMELIQGLSLAELIKAKGPQSPFFSLQIIEQVANGMSAVHKSGIIHRDLKTGNIMLLTAGMLTNQPLIKILDFGIAKSLGSESQVNTFTKAGQIFGSPNSMSPEQARGEPLDHRSDIYSLGCIAFELLTGRPLYLGETVMDVVTQHLNGPAPRLWEVSDIPFPAELERLVAHMVLKDKEERFQTMQEVIKNLREVYAEIPDESPSSASIVDSADAIELVADSRDLRLNTKFLVSSAVAAMLVLASSIYYIITMFKPAPTITPSVMTPFKTHIESSQTDLKIVDAVHTESAFANFAVNHSGRVTERLKGLLAIANQTRTYDLILLQSQLVPGDAKLIAKLDPYKINLSLCAGVTEDLFKELSKVSRLEMINISRVKGLTPKAMSYIAKLPRLTTLIVSGCDLTDEHLKAMKDIKSLRYIKLSKNKKITVKGLHYLGGKSRSILVVADQPSVVLMASAERDKLKNEFNLEVEKATDDGPDEITEKTLEKFSGFAIDKYFDPLDGSMKNRGAKNSLP